MIVKDEILHILNTNGMKVVAYANDLVILVSPIFLSVISESMKRALGKMCQWVARCRLGISPNKTELMTFIAKPSVPEFQLTRLNEQRLALSSQVDVILYLGVSWILT